MYACIDYPLVYQAFNPYIFSNMSQTMIGLDANVLPRALIRDDRQQSQTARDYIASNCSPESPGYINLTVLVEFVWVGRGRSHLTHRIA